MTRNVARYTAAEELRHILASENDTYDYDNDDDVIPSSGEGEDRKPEMILHYNQKKGGVDDMDHLASIFTCRMKTNQWPMVLFYNMLDVAGVVAFFIWISLNPEWAH